MLKRLSLALPVVCALLALAACGGEEGTIPRSPETSTSTSISTSESASESPSTSASAASATCTYPADPMGAAKQVTPPPAQPQVSGSVPVTLATTIGDLHATLDASRTPCTVNSFVSLAEQGFFDKTTCHRMTTSGIYVLQCGDPTGTGNGGPGYSFPDELDGTETYPAGTLAMANAGPDTNGSQFFIVYGNSALGPNYTVFGKVDQATVNAIAEVAKQGTDNAYGAGDGHPKVRVEIDSVKVG